MISTTNQIWLLSIWNGNGFFSNTIIRSIVKHHVLLKWNKDTAVTGDEHVYVKGKSFVNTPSEIYLIILIFIYSYVWNFLKIKILARLTKLREKCIFYLIILITGHSWIIECSFPGVTYLKHGESTSQYENYVLSFFQLS